MRDLEKEVYACRKCKDDRALRSVVKYFPVYSFGDLDKIREPNGTDFLVVGVNPSDQEYKGHNAPLSADPKNHETRSKTQKEYFDKHLKQGEPLYPYFEEISGFFDDQNRGFFDDSVKKKLGYGKSPWEKVGYLDLVKCPTRCSKGQWTKIGLTRQKGLIRNCQGFLKRQLEEYKPRNIIAYGTDVCEWFPVTYPNVKYDPWEITRMQLGYGNHGLLFVPQRQGKHTKPEVIWINGKILQMLNNQDRDTHNPQNPS